MENEQVLASSTAVAQIVEEQLEASGDTSPASPDELRASLDVALQGTAEALTIGYSDPDPARAQQLASAFATAYLDFRTRDALEEIETSIQGVNERLNSVQRSLASVQADIDRTKSRDRLQSLNRQENNYLIEQADLLEQLQGFELQRSTLGQGGEITIPANLPSSPASPNHIQNGLLSLAAGLALGIGLAFLRERLDDHVRSREDVEHQLRSSVLAVVPTFPGRRKKREMLPTLASPKSPSAEAYRTIRTNLQFLGREGGLTVVSVTSPSSGEGKTTTVANLAVTMALAGKRVVAVSCDLRKPALHRLFRLSNDVGLSSFLAGRVSLTQAAQRGGVDNLRVMASGPVPLNPAELLGSNAMEEFLQYLREHADVVLLDTPPVFAVSDALALAPLSDGVIVVADARSTTRGALSHVREQIEQVGGRILGGVLNNFDPSDAKYQPTYYRYYYTYEYRDAAPESRYQTVNGNGHAPAPIPQPEAVPRRTSATRGSKPVPPTPAPETSPSDAPNSMPNEAQPEPHPQDIWR
jgi:capsular exopolysaccharide synthesis family protein